MTSRPGAANANASRVLEGLQGKRVAERCHAHQITQSQDDQGRDPLLAHASKAFEVHQDAQPDARLAREHAQCKTVVGERTWE
jgi:hypothetical protein